MRKKSGEVLCVCSRCNAWTVIGHRGGACPSGLNFGCRTGAGEARLFGPWAFDLVQWADPPLSQACFWGVLPSGQEPVPTLMTTDTRHERDLDE